MPEINIAELQEKLYQRLLPSGWGNALRGFLLSDEMEKILQQLHEETEENRKFTPKLKQVFRYLEECPVDKVKVFMLLQSPYQFMMYEKTVADGIPMSCANTRYAQPSLQFALDSIQETVYPKEKYSYPLDLKVWANQGVLLSNVANTTTIGKTDSHFLLWRPFLIYLLDYLTWNKPGLVYVYMGKIAQGFMQVTPDNNYKIATAHPASAAHNRDERWDCKNVWNKINDLLEKSGKEKVIW